jgi:glycerol kinase
VLGDQQASLFGQIGFDRGDVKCTYGTGGFILLNTGSEPVPSASGCLTTVAYQLNLPSLCEEDRQVVYALEGGVAFAGATIQWLRDHLNLLTSASESEAMALSVPSSEGLLFVPAFSGLLAPRWRDDARAVLINFTTFHNKNHFVRAALESSAYQIREVIEAMRHDVASSSSPLDMKEMRVDGGMTHNSFLMQFQADLSDTPIVRPSVVETTALGAAYVAGLAVGFWSDLEHIRNNWQKDQEFQPNMDETTRRELVEKWNDAVERSLNLA